MSTVPMLPKQRAAKNAAQEDRRRQGAHKTMALAQFRERQKISAQEKMIQNENGSIDEKTSDNVMDAELKSGIKLCPLCAETIQIKAIKCRYCGSMVEEYTQQASRDLAKAVMEGDLDEVRRLLRSGADVNFNLTPFDDSPSYALDVAEGHGQSQIAAYLKSQGGRRGDPANPMSAITQDELARVNTVVDAVSGFGLNSQDQIDAATHLYQQEAHRAQQPLRSNRIETASIIASGLGIATGAILAIALFQDGNMSWGIGWGIAAVTFAGCLYVGLESRCPKCKDYLRRQRLRTVTLDSPIRD